MLIYVVELQYKVIKKLKKEKGPREKHFALIRRAPGNIIPSKIAELWLRYHIFRYI
jgi:hypothetical protein